MRKIVLQTPALHYPKKYDQPMSIQPSEWLTRRGGQLISPIKIKLTSKVQLCNATALVIIPYLGGLFENYEKF